MRVAIPGWIRGPARYENGWILVQESQHYLVHPGQELPFAFAGIRTPDEAVKFAEQFGLLREKTGQQDSTLARERFSDWQREAATLNKIMGMHIDRMAAQAGDAEALSRLGQVIRDDIGQEPIGGYYDFVQTTVLSAYLLNQGIGHMKYDVTVLSHDDHGRPLPSGPQIVRSLIPETLAGVIYDELAAMIEGESPREMRYCADCGRVFLVGDPRQRYCNVTCANRAAHRRRVQRKQNSAATVDGVTQSD